MRKVCAIFAFLAAVCLSAAGQDQYARYNGICEQGGSPVQTNGIDSSQDVQISYPACTIIVFNHGSIVQANIFSDAAGNFPIVQPFTATSTGSFGFYAANGRYDVQLSGAGIVSPFTISDVTLCFNCSGGGGGGSPGGLNTQVQVNNAGAFGGLTNVVPGSLFASAGASTFPFFQLKQTIDIRDVAGVDCTGASDSSTALNALTNVADNVTNKTLSFRGCPLVRLDSQWLIHGQENLEIDLGNAQKPDAGSATTGNTLIFGCNGSAGAVVRVDRSGFLDLHGGGITAKGNACASSFTESLEFTNSGLGGYTSTHNHISDIFISPNTGGSAIASYTGIFINGGPNQEMFDIKNADIYCNNSTASIGFRQTSPNSDSTTLHDGFMVSKCFYGVSNEAGGIVRLRYANLTSNGNFSVFGTGGAAIRGPVQEMANTVLGDGSGPLQVAEPGSQNGGYFVNNHFGASTADIDPTSYYMTAGANVSIQLQGNIFDIAGAGTCANLNASTIIGPGGANAAVLDLGANQKKASCNLWVNPLPSSTLLATNTFNDVSEIAAPSAPGTGLERLYGKAGSGLCAKDSGGTERCTGSGGGGGTPGGAPNSVQYNNAGAFGGVSLAAGQLAVGTSGAPAAQSKPYIDVRDYGAVPDGATDNATAIASAFTVANAATTGAPTVYFGCNGAAATCQYNYSGAGTSPINPTRPMTIQCSRGAVLNYTGTAHAIDMQTTVAFPNLEPYTIDGCEFTGGASYTQGIALQGGTCCAQPSVANVILTNNYFKNFGNRTGYTISATGQNWTIALRGNTWGNYDGSNRNILDAHTATNAYLYASQNFSFCSQAGGTACLTSNPAVGFWIRDAWFDQNQFLGPEPIIRVSTGEGGGGAGGMYIENNEFEMNSASPTPFITCGDPGGTGNRSCTMHLFHNVFAAASSPAAGVPNIGVESPASGSYSWVSSVILNNYFVTPGSGAAYIETGGGTLNQTFGNHGPGVTQDLDWSTASFMGTNQVKENLMYIPYRQHSQAAGPQVDYPLAMDASGPHYVSTAHYHGLAKPLTCNDSSGSGTTQVCQTNPAFNSQGTAVCPVASDVVVYKTTTTNTGPLTLNVNSSGACSPASVVKWGGVALTGGEIIAGIPYQLVFDGTNWNLPGIGIPGPFGSKQLPTSGPCETSGATTNLSLGATFTDTGLSCLPATAIIDAVVYRITSTITTAASFTIGDATTAARFCGTQSTLTTGTTGVCFAQTDQTGASGPIQASAAKVRVTLNVNPGAGAIRLVVFYHTWTPPTS